MTQRFKQLVLLVGLACSTITYSDTTSSTCCGTTTDCGSCSDSCSFTCTQSQNLWQPHAFSVSVDREIMLEKAAWDTENTNEWYGTFGVSFEYWQNWGEKCNTKCCRTLGAMPFWAPNKGSIMTIGDNSGNYMLDGYQMGLGPLENASGGITANNGTVMLTPKVYQFGAEFLLFAGAHQNQRGFFAKLIGPIGVNNINPNLSYSETITSQDYPVGSFDQTSTTTAPYKDIAQSFASGQDAGSFYKQMNYGLINIKRTSSAKFGDLEVAIGYNVVADDHKHLGLALRFSAPTGNVADGIYVLEPIFGKNGHVGAGGEIIAHGRYFQSDEHDRYLDIWFDGFAEHLFNSTHQRTFDLQGNGLGSKYLLVAKYSDTVTGSIFQNEIMNAINLTRIEIESTFAVEANASLALDFHWSGWNVLLAYAAWYRSCEKLSPDCRCATTTNLSQWAVLGRQTPYATDGVTTLNLCQPTAQIGQSEDHKDTVGESGLIKTATAQANRLNKDVALALDISAQRAYAAFSNKASMQFGYTWSDSDYLPYLAVMGAIDVNLKYNTAANWWIIGAQGGLAF